MTEGSELAIAAALEALARATAPRGGRGRAPRGRGSPTLRQPRREGGAHLRPEPVGAVGSGGGPTRSRKDHAAEAVKAAELLLDAATRRSGAPLLGSIALAMGDRAEAASQLHAASASASTPLTLSAYALGAHSPPRRCPRSPPFNDRYNGSANAGAQVLRGRRRRRVGAGPHRPQEPPCRTSSSNTPSIPPPPKRSSIGSAEQLDPCLEGRDVRFVQSFVSLDRRAGNLRLRGRRRRDGSRFVSVGERRRSNASGPPSRSPPTTETRYAGGRCPAPWTPRPLSSRPPCASAPGRERAPRAVGPRSSSSSTSSKPAHFAAACARR